MCFKLINFKQICEALDIGSTRLKQYIREDPTFPVRKIGGEWKSDPEELRDWVRNQPTGAVNNQPTLADETANVIQITPKKKGRPLTQRRPQTPKGGWKVTIPQ
ncbi:MAG: hypothetical protein ABFD18_06465 [Syntrophomonas sp.]